MMMRKCSGTSKNARRRATHRDFVRLTSLFISLFLSFDDSWTDRNIHDVVPLSGEALLGRAAAAMAHRDRRNPFADDPEGEPYLPEDGGHRLQRGWYGNDGTYVPSPTKRAPKPSAETRPRHRGSGAAGDDRRGASGSSSSSRDLRERVATLEAANEKLEREVRALRRAAETANEENKSARANAARHLRAAEDHVGLLLAESRAKADAIAEELERAATASEGPGAGEDPPGASGSATASAGERRELERLRAEVRRFADAQASLDAEAEEREGELAAAWAKIRELQAALAAAGG